MGNVSHCGTYSFFPIKNLGGIGDGGLIVTDNNEVARNAKMLRVHGADKKYHNEFFGYNSCLDTIQAAFLLVKLNYIDTFNTKRCEVAVRDSQKLEKVEKLSLPPIVEGHVFHKYTVRVEGDNRDELQQSFKARDIQTNVYFPVPQNELPVYNKKLVLKNSHQVTRHVLSLPM